LPHHNATQPNHPILFLLITPIVFGKQFPIAMLSLYGFSQSHVPSSDSFPNIQTVFGPCSSLNTTNCDAFLVRFFPVSCSFLCFMSKYPDSPRPVLFPEYDKSFFKTLQINMQFYGQCLYFNTEDRKQNILDRK